MTACGPQDSSPAPAVAAGFWRTPVAEGTRPNRLTSLRRVRGAVPGVEPATDTLRAGDAVRAPGEGYRRSQINVPLGIRTAG